MKKQIVLSSKNISPEELKDRIEKYFQQNNFGISLEIRKSKIKDRALESVVLVAIIGVIGTGVGALLTGLLQLAKVSSSKKIIIQSKSGTRLEVPFDISDEQLDRLIKKVKEMDSEINILIP